MEAAVAAGRIALRTFHEVREIHGEERVEAVTIFDNRTGEETHLACDAVFAFLGFKPDLGPIAHWGLAVEKNRVKVSGISSPPASPRRPSPPTRPCTTWTRRPG